MTSRDALTGRLGNRHYWRSTRGDWLSTLSLGRSEKKAICVRRLNGTYYVSKVPERRPASRDWLPAFCDRCCYKSNGSSVVHGYTPICDSLRIACSSVYSKYARS